MAAPISEADVVYLGNNFQFYAAEFLHIKDKQGKPQPLILNAAQLYVHQRLERQLKETGKVRALILKGRQQGISTYLAGRFYHRTTLWAGQNAFIITHEQKATDNLFNMVKRYHENNPLKPSTSNSNAKELIFDALDGGYKLATAGSKDVGRSNTAQLLHACLSPETLIISGDTGKLVKMRDMSVGDVVRTHTGKTAKVSVRSLQVKSARKVTLSTVRNFPLIATDEHRFLTPEGWLELSQLKAGDEIGFPIKAVTDCGELIAFRQPDSFRPQGGGSRECGPDEIALDYNVGRVAGLYLAEGTVKFQSKSKEPSAVHFSVHEKEVDRTVEWLSKVDVLYKSIGIYRHKNSKTVVVTAYGRSFAYFITALCGSGKEKYLPIRWNEFGEEFARGLAHGYLCGDGHFTPSATRRIIATSIRSSISIGMRDVLVSLGYGWSVISIKPAAVRFGRNEKEAFILTLCGEGVNRLSAEVGKPYPLTERKAGGGKFASRIADGYVWLKILEIDEPALQEVMDFEVDHDDHSYCTVHGATHNSEFAFWENADTHQAGIGNTIADMDGTEIIYETTANGVGNTFHEMWQKAEEGIGEYIAIFVPWFWQKEYRAKVDDKFTLSAEDAAYQKAYGLDMEQMAWRRNKINSYRKGFEWLFDQEYPASPALAFRSSTTNPLISPLLVSASVNSKYNDKSAPLIIGVDPADEGEDRTAIVYRRGRMVIRTETYENKDNMQIVGIVGKIIREFNPRAVFIDKGGVGAGVFSRLRELGHGNVYGVMFGESASENDIFANKRAEMWYRVREWLEDLPNRIPNDLALVSDLSGPSYGQDSSDKLLLESKKAMKKRGIRSPDLGDALALTFAEFLPVEDIGDLRGVRKQQRAASSAGY